MNNPSPLPRQDIRAGFDRESLAWLAAELRTGAQRFQQDLRRAAAEERDPPARASRLRDAHSDLQQARAALRIVDAAGLALLFDAVEAILERIDAGKLPLTASLMQEAGDALHACAAYVAELRTGISAQPLRLYPYYRSLLAALEAERIHPADLLFPGALPAAVLGDAASAATLAPDELIRLRKRFEEALLRFLKSPDRLAATEQAAAMGEIMGDIAQGQPDQAAHSFWRVLQGFAECVAAGSAGDGQRQAQQLRQLFAQINLQLRRVTQGQPLSGSAQRVLKDALFFIAQPEAAAASALVAQIRSAYRLDGLVPPAFEESRYSRVDEEALRQARETLARAKDAWDRLADDDEDEAGAPAGTFSRDMHRLADVADRLNVPALAALMHEMASVSLQAADIQPWDDLGLELATSLLFVENMLENFENMPENCDDRADAIRQRLAMLAAEARPAAGQAAHERAAHERAAHERAAHERADGDLIAGNPAVQITAPFWPAPHDPAAEDGAVSVESAGTRLAGNRMDDRDWLAPSPEADDAGPSFSSLQEPGDTPVVSLPSSLDPAIQRAFASLREDLADFGPSVETESAFDAPSFSGVDDVPLLDAILDPIEKPPPAPGQDTPSDAGTPDALLPEAAYPGSAETGLPELAQNSHPDPDLLPVFLDEGQEALGEIGRALRSWRKHPEDAAWPHALLRHLHTFKGSARVVGALTLGQHVHAMETSVATLAQAGRPAIAQIDALLPLHERNLELFAELQSAAASAAAPLVRVRADILDRLARQADKAGQLNTKLDAGIAALQKSVAALTDNLAGMQQQLQQLETSAGEQIAARMSITGSRDFTPAEFDRLARLRDVALSMAHSVTAVGDLRQSLGGALDKAAMDVAMQARLNADMRQSLARTRMARFAGIAERLYRVAFQTARESGKRINLGIVGGATEIDRTILERIPGPLEHLLRNAIVHGIESADDRRAAGKNETGELTLEVRQEGGETVIQVADDGRGLNLHRIRRKAVQQGLLALDAALSDAQARELIFLPGFSTLDEISGLAGRGMGLDAVRADIDALGGRISVYAENGRGTHFTIRVPATPADGGAVSASSGAQGKASAARGVVLVADDSPAVRRATQRLLSRAGYEALLARDGLEALEQLQTVTPDLLLIDVEMPRLDGMGLLRTLRADVRMRTMPVVMISSRTSMKHRDEAAALGVRAYLGKPYRDEELMELIAELVR